MDAYEISWETGKSPQLAGIVVCDRVSAETDFG
jgi:hypothetical protein